MIKMVRVGAVSYDLTLNGKTIEVIMFRKADDISRYLLFRAQIEESHKKKVISLPPE